MSGSERRELSIDMESFPRKSAGHVIRWLIQNELHEVAFSLI